MKSKVGRCAVVMLLLIFSISVSAQQMTLNLKGDTVEQALEILKNQYGYSFIFKTDDIDLKKKVTSSFKNVEITEVLKQIFDDQDVVFSISGKMVRIEKVADSQTPSLRTVRGRVCDVGGEPLIGVGVVQLGTTNGAVTDFTGAYSIEVPDGVTLQFSYLGYETKDVPLGKSDKVNIYLSKVANDLDEAVVIGYGTMKKSDLTGAVSSVKTDNLPVASNTSIAHMLSGRAAGVSVVQNSAQPGGGVEMLIRGAASTGAGNAPLYIIDGFPVSGGSVEPAADNRYSDFGSRNPLNSINPNDIASIEILKDASSTAIYGARAANGVIIITTRKGREGRAVVNYNASYGVQQIANKIEMMNATDFMIEANKFAEEKWYYDNRIYPYGNTDPSTVKTKLELPYSDKDIANAGEGTDWYDLVTQTGMIHQQNVSVSGGTQNLKYMASFNFYDQNGVVKNSDFTRYSGRLNVEHKINKIFTYGV